MTFFEFMYLSIGLAAWVFIIANIVAVYYIIRFVKSFKLLSGSVNNFLMSILVLKGGIKMGVYSLLLNNLKNILGGVKHEQRK